MGRSVKSDIRHQKLNSLDEHFCIAYDCFNAAVLELSDTNKKLRTHNPSSVYNSLPCRKKMLVNSALG